jgi:hypothetical protein
MLLHRSLALLLFAPLLAVSGCGRAGSAPHPTIHLDGGTGNCMGVNLQTDNNNCGACGAVCAMGFSCQAGRCTNGCATGQIQCSGACVDTSTDSANCGGCGMACPTGQTCQSGACATPSNCTGTQVSCGGVCTDTSNDPANCGSCGTTCGTGQSCTNGSCSGGNPGNMTGCAGLIPCLNNCMPTDMACQQACVSNTTTQGRMLAQALFTCINMACPGANGGVCDMTAANFNQTNCQNCLMKAQNTGGACVSQVTACAMDTNGMTGPCPNGQTSCGGICTDLTSDPANCGACGTACNVGDNCVAGQCSAGMGGMTGCNGLVACLNACMVGDMACEQACIANSTQMAQSLLNTLFMCLDMACPSMNGGVCDMTSRRFSQAACDNCYMQAQSAGGQCVNEIMACNNNTP